MVGDLSVIYFRYNGSEIILLGGYTFLALNDEFDSNKLDWVRDIYSDRVPPNLVFIATTECADNICFDLNDGTVYYWDAYDEDDTGRRLYKIADSFEQFLDALYRDEHSPKMDPRT